jgi:glyoxylase-like metal-dependent hydrolase (beta-lactamase superfamily II)
VIEENAMKLRAVCTVLSLLLLVGTVWLAGRGDVEAKPTDAWTEVTPGVLRSPGAPAGYALITGDRALLIDAPAPPDGLKTHGVKKIKIVLLTHHHRDSLAAVEAYLGKRIPVRAPAASASWLLPAGVEKHWKESLPLRGSRTAYLVVPEGLAGIDCSIRDDMNLDWGDWTIRAVAAPGHSRDHFAYLVQKKAGGKRLLFCGDALAEEGKLWSPYTTDWDHWTDAGLRPAAETLRQLAKLKPNVLLPAHGEVIGHVGKARSVVRALEKTAELVDENAFLKSYERYTRQRRKDPPKYNFLAKEQAGSNGSKPWSHISKNLWLTGNTFVLVSTDGPCLVVDPWDPHSAKQIPKLQKEEKIGKVEVVLCSHAHFDHYDGAYVILERDKPQVWTLDQVAGPIAEPFRLLAPFLDARPLTVHRRMRDRETIRWREYTLRFHFLPGQTLFTMGVETTIDGKKCLFTADNFFHHDLYSGTGGWMGLNRSGPLLYAASARKVLDIAPDWVLAEHGSAMEFNADDFRRRVEWAQLAARTADALCVSGQYRHDWDPHHVHLEPVLHKVKPGATIAGDLVVENVLGKARKLRIFLAGRSKTPDQTWDVEVGPGATVRTKVALKLSDKLPPGRHILALRVSEGDRVDPGDAFVAVDVADGR